MNGERFFVGFAMIIWLLGYLNPGEMSNAPFKPFNTYIRLPIWLNGLLRRKHSLNVPAGVVSAPALTAQVGSILMILLYFGFQIELIEVGYRFDQLYGYIMCYILAGIISLVIQKFRPYGMNR